MLKRKMTMNMITGAGWVQSLWCYNAFAVKRGSWSGYWYGATTQEDDGTGNFYTIEGGKKGAQWRAFTSWQEAVDDYINRIDTHSRYAPAKNLFWDESVSVGKWWAVMRSRGYATDTTKDDEAYADSIDRKVCRELASATPEELKHARENIPFFGTPPNYNGTGAAPVEKKKTNSMTLAIIAAGALFLVLKK